MADIFVTGIEVTIFYLIFFSVCFQGLHLDPSIYLMNEESGGFGSGAVQMKALASTSATVKIEERNGNTGEKLTSCKYFINNINPTN